MHRYVVRNSEAERLRSVIAVVLVGTAIGVTATCAAAQMDTSTATRSFATIDTDKDHRLDRAELTAAAARDFDRLDIDHDRYLTAGELKAAHSVKLLLPLPGRLESPAAFIAADSDHDAKIDEHEYETAIVRAYLSCDANHDGTIEMSDLKHCGR